LKKWRLLKADRLFFKSKEEAMERISRVLVIEESPSFAEKLTNVLMKGGFAASWLKGQAANRETVAKQRPDIIFCKMEMPQSGLQIFQDLAQDERIKNVPFVLMSFLALEAHRTLTVRQNGSAQARLFFLQQSTFPEVFLEKVMEIVMFLEDPGLFPKPTMVEVLKKFP
jgi:CheY-like chemotaxis protein